MAGAVHDVRDLLPDARLDFRVPPDLPLVPADPRLLHHILLNLLTNAATHGAGKVTIAGERLPHGVVEVLVLHVQQSGRAVLDRGF